MKETDDQILERSIRGVKALIARHLDSPIGFKYFYELVYNTILPEHGWEWINKIYDAKHNDRGVLLWAFRGSWKTSIVTLAFGAYRIGQQPFRANLIIQANDDSSEKSAAAIADVIDNNPGWKLVFPYVVPDKPKAWGANGYEVKDIRMPYGSWRQKCASRRDPTLLGVGYKSSSLIGRHPDGFLTVDDIHDEENTSSSKEMRQVITRMTGTVLPMVVEDETKAVGQRLLTWETVIGTPWSEDDVYHYLKDTGEFEFLETPVMIPAEMGQEDAVEITEDDMTSSVHTDILGWYKLKWPERFSKRIVVSWRNKSGKREFFRMYMLDLRSSFETGLKYFLYPSEKIDPNWPASGGLDYASIQNKTKPDDKRDRNFFALAYGLKVPTGGAVIMDGVFEQCTQAAAEQHVIKAQNMFRNWAWTYVEGDGRGDEFISVMQRQPHIRIVPMHTQGKGKEARLERQLAPWLEIGLLRISDANTPFLNALRKALDEYPNWHLDPIDAIYWYARSIPDVLQIKSPEDELPAARIAQRRTSPFARLGNV